MTQPEALRLADLLDCSVVVSDQQAAAELRRLHAENEALAMNLRMEEAISFRRQMQMYAAQRDALLEALRDIANFSGEKAARERARAAIAKAEGEKT